MTRGASGDRATAGRVIHHMRSVRERSPVRFAVLLAIVATLSCSGEHVVDVPRIVVEYTIFEPSRVLYPRSYYSDSTDAYFLYNERLRFDETGHVLTRASSVERRNLLTGISTNASVTAHITVQRKGNTLVLGAPDVCAPHADCTAGRVLRIPATGSLVEPPGRYGSDSLVFGPPSVLISREQ